MDFMRIFVKFALFITLMLMALTISCSSIKTVSVWKDEGHNQRLRKVLVIAVAEQDFMRNHFENMLAQSLASRGIEATPSNKVFPQSQKLERSSIEAKVRELGIGSVLVARVVSKDEESRIYSGGVYLVPTDYYSGWYGFYSGSFAFVPVPGSAYDAEFFTMVTNIYDVSSEKLVWSYFSKVKVENSRQGAINPFIDALMKQLDGSKLL
jgi:hypothetical protein